MKPSSKDPQLISCPLSPGCVGGPKGLPGLPGPRGPPGKPRAVPFPPSSCSFHPLPTSVPTSGRAPPPWPSPTSCGQVLEADFSHHHRKTCPALLKSLPKQKVPAMQDSTSAVARALGAPRGAAVGGALRAWTAAHPDIGPLTPSCPRAFTKNICLGFD